MNKDVGIYFFLMSKTDTWKHITRFWNIPEKYTKLLSIGSTCAWPVGRPVLISILQDARGTGPSKNGVGKETQLPVIS